MVNTIEAFDAVYSESCLERGLLFLLADPSPDVL